MKALEDTLVADVDAGERLVVVVVGGFEQGEVDGDGDTVMVGDEVKRRERLWGGSSGGRRRSALMGP